MTRGGLAALTDALKTLHDARDAVSAIAVASALAVDALNLIERDLLQAARYADKS